MEITTTTIERKPARHAAISALALVGFIALLALGIWLAIYTVRSLPGMSSRFGGAAVSLSSIFRGNDDDGEAKLDVVTSTTTIPFLDETVSTTTATTTPEVVRTSNGSTGSTQTRGTITTTTTTTIKPYGDSDLTVRITSVGYLKRDGDTDSFESSNSVPSGKDAAVKFTVTNVGTNVTGDWRFNASVPTSPSRDFSSPTQRSLKPGDSIDYVLGFEKGKKGENRDIKVTVDSGRDVRESNENNNTATRDIDIKD